MQENSEWVIFWNAEYNDLLRGGGGGRNRIKNVLNSFSHPHQQLKKFKSNNATAQ